VTGAKFDEAAAAGGATCARAEPQSAAAARKAEVRRCIKLLAESDSIR
jgi:hypothetical protein